MVAVLFLVLILNLFANISASQVEIISMKQNNSSEITQKSFDDGNSTDEENADKDYGDDDNENSTDESDSDEDELEHQKFMLSHFKSNDNVVEGIVNSKDDTNVEQEEVTESNALHGQQDENLSKNLGIKKSILQRVKDGEKGPFKNQDLTWDDRLVLIEIKKRAKDKKIKKKQKERQYLDLLQENDKEYIDKLEENIKLKRELSLLDEQRANFIVLHVLSHSNVINEKKTYFSLKDFMYDYIDHAFALPILNVFKKRNDVLRQDNFDKLRSDQVTESYVDIYSIIIKPKMYSNDYYFAENHRGFACSIYTGEAKACDITSEPDSLCVKGLKKCAEPNKFTRFDETNCNILPQFLLWCGLVTSVACIQFSIPIIKNYYNNII